MQHFSLHKSRKLPSHKNVISNPLPFPDPSFTIKLFEAKLIVNLAKMGEMQTYVKVLFGGGEWNSSVSAGHLNPKWREAKSFSLQDVKKQKSASQISDFQMKKHQQPLSSNFVEIIVYHKSSFKLFSDEEVGRRRIDLFSLASPLEWYSLTKKSENVGSILISIQFENFKSEEVQAKREERKREEWSKEDGKKEEVRKEEAASKVEGKKDEGRRQDWKREEGRRDEERIEEGRRDEGRREEGGKGLGGRIKTLEGESFYGWTYRNCGRSRDNSSLMKQQCKTEISPQAQSKYLTDHSEDMEEIQKKYESLDENSNSDKSLMEELDDMDESIFSGDLRTEEEAWNELLYEKNEPLALRDINEILEELRLENDDLKERERKIKLDFERLKSEYGRIAKERKNTENRKIQLQKRETCVKQEKRFLFEELANFKSEQLALQREADLLKSLQDEEKTLQIGERDMIYENLEREERMMVITRGNMVLAMEAARKEEEGLKKNIRKRANGGARSKDTTFAEDDDEDSEEKDYKNELFGRIGIDGKFDLTQYAGQLDGQIRGLEYQLEAKGKDIEYMEQRMRLYYK